VPWKLVEKLFFNKGLISDLILLGKANKQDFPEKCYNKIFEKKNGMPRVLAAIVELST
jgi:hypothetical protein